MGMMIRGLTNPEAAQTYRAPGSTREDEATAGGGSALEPAGPTSSGAAPDDVGRDASARTAVAVTVAPAAAGTPVAAAPVAPTVGAGAGSDAGADAGSGSGGVTVPGSAGCDASASKWSGMRTRSANQ